nr:hypothetical protein [Variovorax boronicumulans]
MVLRNTLFALLALAAALLAAVAPFKTFQLPLIPSAVLSTTVLALPFFVFAAAIYLLRHRRSVGRWLVPLCVASYLPWQFSIVLITWFKLALSGALVFGGMMGLGALVVVWVYHRATRPAAPIHVPA